MTALRGAMSAVLATMMVACMLMHAAEAQPQPVHIADGSIFYKPKSVKSLKLYHFGSYEFSLPQCGPRDDYFHLQFLMVNNGYSVVYSWDPNESDEGASNLYVNGITEIAFDVKSGLLNLNSWGVGIQINLNNYLPTDPYQKQYGGSVKPDTPILYNRIDKIRITTTLKAKKLAYDALHVLGRAAAKFGEGSKVKYPCREKQYITGHKYLKNLSAYLHAVKMSLLK